MTVSTLIYCIGNIDDKYIESYNNFKKTKMFINIVKGSIVAACFSLILVLGIGIFSFISKNEISSPYIQNSVIWDDNNIGQDQNIESSLSLENGQIIISESLQNAINKSKSKNDIFAVYVTETSGIDKEILYKNFIQKLNLKENFMEDSVIFATAEQITNMKCPPDYSIFLTLANNSKSFKKETIVDSNYISNLDSKTIDVTVYLKFDQEKVINDIKEYEKTMSEEEYQQLYYNMVSALIQNSVNDLIKDLNVDRETISDIGIYIPRFTIRVDKDMLERIYEYENVESIILCTNDAGQDLS